MRKLVIAVCVTLVVGVLVVPSAVGAGVPTVVSTTEQEPNDDFGTAQLISEGTLTGEIVDGESDIYQLEANTTDALDVRVKPTADDLEFRIYAPNRTMLAEDTLVFAGTTNRLTIKVPRNGTYYVEVTGNAEQTTTDYNLTVDRVTPAENDAFAPNDDFSSAVSITQETTTATLWGGESDFYQLNLNASDGLTVSVRPTDDDVEFRIYAPNQTQSITSTASQQRPRAVEFG